MEAIPTHRRTPWIRSSSTACGRLIERQAAGRSTEHAAVGHRGQRRTHAGPGGHPARGCVEKCPGNHPQRRRGHRARRYREFARLLRLQRFLPRRRSRCGGLYPRQFRPGIRGSGQRAVRHPVRPRLDRRCHQSSEQGADADAARCRDRGFRHQPRIPRDHRHRRAAQLDRRLPLQCDGRILGSRGSRLRQESALGRGALAGARHRRGRLVDPHLPASAGEQSSRCGHPVPGRTPGTRAARRLLRPDFRSCDDGRRHRDGALQARLQRGLLHRRHAALCALPVRLSGHHAELRRQCAGAGHAA